MITAASRILKAKWPETRIVALEPTSSPFVKKGHAGHAGPHGVEGIGAGRRHAMCRRLAREEGMFVGTSTGSNVVSAGALAKELGPEKTAVTVAVDAGLKYLNGILLANAWGCK
ncbi:pyridoxal phosphate-dependent enzyme beta subunit [Penicillium canescens]|nr:pyridoxal phosphate-dependent enzyme beta subunit [Penicillium canescens]